MICSGSPPTTLLIPRMKGYGSSSLNLYRQPTCLSSPEYFSLVAYTTEQSAPFVRMIEWNFGILKLSVAHRFVSSSPPVNIGPSDVSTGTEEALMYDMWVLTTRVPLRGGADNRRRQAKRRERSSIWLVDSKITIWIGTIYIGSKITYLLLHPPAAFSVRDKNLRKTQISIRRTRLLWSNLVQSVREEISVPIF